MPETTTALEPAEPTWAPAALMMITDLKPGDFVERVPAQFGYRGTRVMSAVSAVSYDERWTRSAGYRKRRLPTPARLVTFLSVGPISYPAEWTVIARRRTS